MALCFCSVSNQCMFILKQLCLKSSNCSVNNFPSLIIQIHDADAPWRNYLVVLEGNVEEKKPKTPTKEKMDKLGAGERKGSPGKISSDAGAAKSNTDSLVVQTEPVTLPSDWATHGAIALVSHGALGGITVIHTEVPPGTQLQPIVTTDSTGASVISLDGSSLPFSLPVSMAQSLPLVSDAASTLVVPVSDGAVTSDTETPTMSTSSVLEAAASQTILAPGNKTPASEGEILSPDIQTVIITDKCIEELKDEQQKTDEKPTEEPEEAHT